MSVWTDVISQFPFNDYTTMIKYTSNLNRFVSIINSQDCHKNDSLWLSRVYFKLNNDQNTQSQTIYIQ